MRAQEILSTPEPIRLNDIAEVKTNFEEADFWLIRKGTEAAVGTVTKKFSPEHIGIKVTATDRVLPDYLYYVMMHLHQQGLWGRIATGTTRLVNIRTQDVARLPLFQNQDKPKHNWL